MPNILDIICQHKLQEVAVNAAKIGVSNMQQMAYNAQASNGAGQFVNAIQNNVLQGKPAVIAELKKASPSKGLIRKDFSPSNLAKQYAIGGAACLSVLTDAKFFMGCNAYLQEAKQASGLPAIRKDFIITPYQVYEAKAIGADAILLIMACLTDEQATKLEDLAHKLELDVLVEVHNKQELDRALKLKTPLIGVNNRNLKTMKVDINTSIELKKYIPSNKIMVCESGIKTREHILLMQKHGINSFLIGESLMLQDNLTKALQKLIG